MRRVPIVLAEQMMDLLQREHASELEMITAVEIVRALIPVSCPRGVNAVADELESTS